MGGPGAPRVNWSWPKWSSERHGSHGSIPRHCPAGSERDKHEEVDNYKAGRIIFLLSHPGQRQRFSSCRVAAWCCNLGAMPDPGVQIEYNQELTALVDVLQRVERPGEFFASGSLAAPMP